MGWTLGIGLLHPRPDLVNENLIACCLPICAWLYNHTSLELSRTHDERSLHPRVSLYGLFERHGIRSIPIAEHEKIIKSSDVPPEVGFGRVLLEQVFGTPLGELMGREISRNT
jgi:hypothetical protein